ncbi:MAG TPA: hypothetical protein PLP17_06620, partial [Oligoflexia bacterium]|nr:hypothetical protein [Oligoflexia bacterium]
MNCETCGCMFDVSAHEAEMYRRFGFPPENICFECSAKHKIAFRNGRNMYRRKCDATGEDILSIYSPDKPFQVYKSGAWYSDSWDGLDYGTEYDFSRSFFDQFAALKLRVPRLALTNMQAENSEYCNMTYGNKNCYLVFGGDFNEDTMFGTLCMHNRSCLDCDFSNYNELCCEVSDCIRCYGCWFAFDCANCTDCALISDCTACQDCILCCNLVQRRWCVRNKQLSKEEYAAEKAKLLDGSYTSQRRCTDELRELRQRRIVKHSHLVSCENVSGGYIKNSRNCFNAYDVSDSEDVVDAVFAIEAKDCFRCALIGHGSEQCFNMMS